MSTSQYLDDKYIISQTCKNSKFGNLGNIQKKIMNLSINVCIYYYPIIIIYCNTIGTLT